MSDGEYEFSKSLPSSGVERAIYMTRRLVKSAGVNHDSETDAIDEVAQQCRLGRSVIERFLFPSRWPKSIDADLLERIRGVYLRWLRGQLAAIENEIVSIERFGSREPSVEHLLDAARALVHRIEAVTDRRR